MNDRNLKDQLKESLQKKELVKPNLTEERLVMEVESLCDGFCNVGANTSRGDHGVPVSDGDILF